jgi:hypothetical protein
MPVFGLFMPISGATALLARRLHGLDTLKRVEERKPDEWESNRCCIAAIGDSARRPFRQLIQRSICQCASAPVRRLMAARNTGQAAASGQA